MTIEKRTVFVSPDGQFHATEFEAEQYVKLGKLTTELRGEIISYLEQSDGDPFEDGSGIANLLLEKFNISFK
jgi:hypothetical protein